MNTLCNAANYAGESFTGNLNRAQIRTPETTHVLSVGPMDRGCMVYDVLLNGPRTRLSIAPDCRQLWSVPKRESVQVAILHNALSPLELEEASQFIRRQWPHARILVIRSGEDFLDDALYDDRVTPPVAPRILLAAIARLSHEWHQRTSRNV
jgi:hypothetical protein